MSFAMGLVIGLLLAMVTGVASDIFDEDGE